MAGSHPSRYCCTDSEGPDQLCRTADEGEADPHQVMAHIYLESMLYTRKEHQDNARVSSKASIMSGDNLRRPVVWALRRRYVIFALRGYTLVNFSAFSLLLGSRTTAWVKADDH